LPLLAVVFFILYFKAKSKLNKNFHHKLLNEFIMPSFSSTKFIVRFLLYLLALLFLFIAAADPQEGSKLEEVKRSGIDLVICLDVSNSMLAEDLSPNRLIAAKRAISRLIDNLKGDRIGLVVFAGQAYTQLPITTDYAAAKMFLETINTDIVPTQGTAIGAAINQAISDFPENSKNKKAIIVLTDGENHEDDAIDVATKAAENGIVVHTIGLGSITGTPIPLYINGYKSGFKKDKEGNVVVTKLNEELLQQIAAAGKGVYARATNAGVGLDLVFNEINKLEKNDYENKIFTSYENRFQYFVAPALFILLLEIVLSNKKSDWLKKWGLTN
jgi:Ca-activated chloride channel family protein